MLLSDVFMPTMLSNRVSQALICFLIQALTMKMTTEDRMDPVTLPRYYAASSPHLAKIVLKRNQKMRVRLDHWEITNWVQGV